MTPGATRSIFQRAERGLKALLAIALALGCSSPKPRADGPPSGVVLDIPEDRKPAATAPPGETHVPPAQKPQPVDDSEQPQIEDEYVQLVLARVARARGLPILRPVPSKVLERDAMLARIRAQVDREIPADVLRNQGETLSAFELVPPDYDYVEGSLQLIGGQIAGFYDPKERTMFLAADLGEAEAEETLTHELAHALADQSFPLDPMVEFRRGDSDRITAAHAVIEGDATSAMLDVALGSAFTVSETMLRRLLLASTAFSSVGAKTPRVLVSSLIAPYSDGFSLVQALRRRGGWPAVDKVWKQMPETTEQLLHLDKLDAREPAKPIGVPPVSELGPEFDAVLDDVLGEQGLRLTLEEWADRDTAADAAAGWGGDRLVVARKGPKDARDGTIAVAWHLEMDTAKDAAEVTAVLKKRFGSACKMRPDLGPIYWTAKGTKIVAVSGPYERTAGTPKSAGDCALAKRWAEAIMQAGRTPKR